MASLALRLARLERRPDARRKLWREYLERCFTEPQYAEHRERIIEALMSPQPQYSFTVEQEPAYGGESAFYLVSWWTRGDVGKPYSKVIILEGGPELAALTPPAVSVYPGAWALDANVGREDEQDETPEE